MLRQIYFFPLSFESLDSFSYSYCFRKRLESESTPHISLRSRIHGLVRLLSYYSHFFIHFIWVLEKLHVLVLPHYDSLHHRKSFSISILLTHIWVFLTQILKQLFHFSSPFPAHPTYFVALVSLPSLSLSPSPCPSLSISFFKSSLYCGNTHWTENLSSCSLVYSSV